MLRLDTVVGGRTLVHPTGSAGTGSSVTSGWTHIRTQDPARVSVIYRERRSGRPDFEASVPAREPTYKVAGIFDNRPGYSTALAIANPNSRAIRLNITIRNGLQGIVIRSDSLTLAASGHTTFFLQIAWPETANIFGRIDIEAVDSVTGDDATFVPIGLRFSPGGAFTTLPF